MSWYDFFGNFYDRFLERSYFPFRQRSFKHLAAEEGATILDLACGTGQNLPHLAPRVGTSGLVFEVDLSEGMLKRAADRAAREGWSQVHPLARDVRDLKKEELVTMGAPQSGLDAVVCTLGLTVVPDWEEVLESSLSLLRPGGQILIMDVFSEKWNPMKPLVELLARADISRDVAGAIKARSAEFAREAFSDASPWVFGGTLFVAHGTKG